MAKAATHWTDGKKTRPMLVLNKDRWVSESFFFFFLYFLFPPFFRAHQRQVHLPGIKSKGTANLVEGDQLGELPGVHEEVVAEVFQVAVDESLLGIETKCDDVAGIVEGILHGILAGERFVEDGLLVIRQHEDQGHVEALLKPLGELHGDGVSEMETTGTGAPAGVEEKGLATFIAVEDLVEVTMAEEETATEPAVRLPASDSLEAFEDGLVDSLGLPLAIGERTNLCVSKKGW